MRRPLEKPQRGKQQDDRQRRRRGAQPDVSERIVGLNPGQGAQSYNQRTVNIVSIEDFRRAARRRLPPQVFDYIDGGAEAEVTLRENVRAFEDISFHPRSAVDT